MRWNKDLNETNFLFTVLNRRIQFKSNCEKDAIFLCRKDTGMIDVMYAIISSHKDRNDAILVICVMIPWHTRYGCVLPQCLSNFIALEIRLHHHLLWHNHNPSIISFLLCPSDTSLISFEAQVDFSCTIPYNISLFILTPSNSLEVCSNCYTVPWSKIMRLTVDVAVQYSHYGVSAASPAIIERIEILSPLLLFWHSDSGITLEDVMSYWWTNDQWLERKA